MAKIRNKLYSDPKKARAHDKGAEIRLVQPIRVNDIKIGLEAIYYPYNFYINVALKAENQANNLLDEILKKVRKDSADIPYVENDKSNSFIEFAITAIVWSYAAIEGYANDIISLKAPDKKKERLLKLDTAQKLKIHLPKLLSKIKINNTLWDKFHKLDEIRHKVIHTKTSQYWMDHDKWDNTIVFQLYNGIYKGSTKTAIDIIEHFKPEHVNTGPVTYNVVRGMGAKPAK